MLFDFVAVVWWHHERSRGGQRFTTDGPQHHGVRGELGNRPAIKPSLLARKEEANRGRGGTSIPDLSWHLSQFAIDSDEVGGGGFMLMHKHTEEAARDT